MPALAEELVRLKVDIIVADSYSAARDAKKVSTTIPSSQQAAPIRLQPGLRLVWPGRGETSRD